MPYPIKKRPKFPEKPMPPQKIIGTLILKKVDYKNVSPLSKEHMARIKKNLKKIYEESQHLKTNSIVDSDPTDPRILIISFNYNQAVIDRIKGLDRNERAWDPDNKVWRVFISCFDDIFDILGNNFILTKACYENLSRFIIGRYYANIATGKLGKLTVRESWYEELEDEDLAVDVFPGSTLDLADPKGHTLDSIFAEARHIVQSFPFERKPYSHQISGMEFLLMNPACALLDEMGCGKSFQIAASITMLHNQGTVTKTIIVAPKSLIHTWKYELSLASSRDYQVIAGNPKERRRCLESDTPIFLIHYEGMRLEQEALAEWALDGKTLIVFDESQRIKNLSAKTTAAALFVRRNTQRCIIATGTPIANRPLDLFSQYLVMDQGHTFGTQFAKFKNTFCNIEILEIPAGRRKIRVEKFISVKNPKHLQRKIQATSLRRLKEEVLDLPPVIFKDFVVDMSPEQKSLYMKVRDDVKSEIEHLSPGSFQSQQQNIVVKLLRLSQIASNPSLFDKNFEGPNSKFQELDTLLDDVMEDDTKKVILWSHFVENVKTLRETYAEKWGAVCHTGEMPGPDRQQSISDFQDNPAARLFIATPQSAKEGLTLLPRDGKMRADTMIYLDMNFDAASYVQSQARFHRIGQESQKCLVVHLIGSNTIDSYIRSSLDEKLKTAAQIVDDKERGDLTAIRVGNSLQLDSKEQVLNLFSNGVL